MATTVLTGHETKSGVNSKGTWMMNLFTAQDGEEYQTFNVAIASQALALMGQTVDIAYEEQIRGNFTNKVITTITASAQSAPPPPTVAQTVVLTEIKPVDRNAGIARAIETFGVAGEDPLANQEELFELADIYARYGALGEKPSVAVTTDAPTV